MHDGLELEKQVLEYLKSIQTRKDYSADFWEIAREINADPKNVKIACSDLNQKEYIRYTARSNYKNKFFAVITTAGKEALQTEYDQNWINQQEREENEERDLRRREVKASESSHLWTKIGTVGAIVISVIALIVSVIK